MAILRSARSAIRRSKLPWPLLAAGLLCVHAAAQQASEYDLKAAYLLNFTKFVEWPAEAFPDRGSPLAICLLGDDPFGPTLDQIVAGETVNGRSLVVRRLQHAPQPKACQVLYVRESGKEVAGILTQTGPGVLTVGEGDSFIRAGGMIAFVIDDRRVRFDIAQTAAARARLRVSSRLMNVARSADK